MPLAGGDNAMRPAFALLAMACGAGILAPAQAASPVAAMISGDVFAPPVGRAMILSRTVIRDLPGGKQIVATRRYRVRFLRNGAGYRLDGTLIASEISAPEQLRELAEMERKRPDDGLFPLELDGSGQIVGGGEAGQGDRQATEAALRTVDAMLADSPSANGAEQDQAFLARLRMAVAGPLSAHWPVALFIPGTQVDRQERSFRLPDGSEGHFVSEVQRKSAADGGTMNEAERRITTSIGGEDSVALERWTLALEG